VGPKVGLSGLIKFSAVAATAPLLLLAASFYSATRLPENESYQITAVFIIFDAKNKFLAFIHYLCTHTYLYNPHSL
jgi:hypothetical protein